MNYKNFYMHKCFYDFIYSLSTASMTAVMMMTAAMMMMMITLIELAT